MTSDNRPYDTRPYRILTPGDPAPWFYQRSTSNENYAFSSVAGRYVVLCFYGSAADPMAREALGTIAADRNCFDDDRACFFGVSLDPSDEAEGRVKQRLPGIRFFWDFDGAIGTEYGAVVDRSSAAGAVIEASYRRHTLLLDPLLRVVAVLSYDDSPETHVARLLTAMASMPPVGAPSLADSQAPVLIAPRVFEPELCRMLIEYYQARGGHESGFMRERDGLTVRMTDYGHKRRRDEEIADERLRKACMVRIHDRLAPEIHKAFQFRATRIERYVVACYDAAEEGHFRPHRDNTTKGTAHRRFAVSLHLNTGEYEGGYLRFPEFGAQLYAAPLGGAVVFSCSLLHEATPVTKGRRFMFLPFLYDDAAAQIRDRNLAFVADPGAG